MKHNRNGNVTRVAWRVRRTADGYEGEILIPSSLTARNGTSAAAPVKISASGQSRKQALRRAATVADAILDSPVMRAALPPGAAPAIEAVKAIASSKDARRALGKYAGEGAKRLAAAIGF